MKMYLVLVVLSLGGCDMLGINDPVQPTPSDSEVVTTGLVLQKELKTNQSEWVYSALGEFDFHSIPNIDSIIFEPNVRSQTSEEHCIVELFDMNKDAVIPNSYVESYVQYYYHRVRSGNLVSFLPKEPVELSLRFRSSIDNHNVEIGFSSSIIVYSH